MKNVLLLMLIIIAFAGCAKTGDVNVVSETEGKSIASGGIEGLGLQEIFNTGKEAKCVAEIEGNTAVFYLKDGKERVESVSEQGEAITIFHGSTMY
ncbi:hypothetical protein KY345_06325, partial [Candidatus Woesearchaeota archaeon]|nr:hypothetical protein [Candidatus Woesearchaeota archaeon]